MPGRLHTLPVGPASLLATGLLPLGSKLEVGRLLARLPGLDTAPLARTTVAEWLERHPKVAWVSYAGLPSSPFCGLAERYLPRGAGAVFTVGLKGGYEAGIKVVEGVQLFSHLANIGDCRSLIIHPASTTHRQMSEQEQMKAGVTPDMVRMSVGIESIDDILWDIDQALGEASKA